MSHSLQLSFHDLVAAQPPVVSKLDTFVTTDRSASPAGIQDRVTLSHEALALSSPSNLLTFATSDNAILAALQGAATTSTESLIQQLVERGDPLSEIAFDLGMSLTEVETELGIETFSVAA